MTHSDLRRIVPHELLLAVSKGDDRAYAQAVAKLASFGDAFHTPGSAFVVDEALQELAALYRNAPKPSPVAAFSARVRAWWRATMQARRADPYDAPIKG